MPKLAILMLLGAGLHIPKEYSVIVLDQSPLSLTIRTLNDHCSVGDPIEIEATVTNTSTITATFPVRTAEFDYEFIVRDPHNVPPQETDRLKRAKDKTKAPFFFRSFSETLKPGDSFRETFRITDYYDFSDPGGYSIQVSRQVGRHKADVVTSNMITMIVAPKESGVAADTKSTGCGDPSIQ